MVHCKSFMDAAIHHRRLASTITQGRPDYQVASPNHLCKFQTVSKPAGTSVLAFVTVFMIRTKGSVYVAVILCIHKLRDYSIMSTSHFFFSVARTWSRSFLSFSSGSAGALETLLFQTNEKKKKILSAGAKTFTFFAEFIQLCDISVLQMLQTHLKSKCSLKWLINKMVKWNQLQVRAKQQ